MKLIYLGEELDVTKEHELITESEFGYKIDIKYTAESWYKDKEDTAYNAVECHWRFPSIFDDEGVIGKDVAFESDIFGTGFTRKIENIESVTITMAEKLYDKF